MDVQTRADLDRIRWATTDLAVEIPSWGFVNTGTRFRVFPQAGVPRDAFEKVEDAATVARYTGIVDHSKWGRAMLATFCRSERIARIVTDAPAGDELVEAVRRAGIELVEAPESASDASGASTTQFVAARP